VGAPRVSIDPLADRGDEHAEQDEERCEHRDVEPRRAEAAEVEVQRIDDDRPERDEQRDAEDQPTPAPGPGERWTDRCVEAAAEQPGQQAAEHDQAERATESDLTEDVAIRGRLAGEPGRRQVAAHAHREPSAEASDERAHERARKATDAQRSQSGHHLLAH